MNRSQRRATQARASRRERQAAEALGSSRVQRERYESAPDVRPVTTPAGITVIPEIKSRLNPPKTIARWVRQAESYTTPGQHGVVIVFGKNQTLQESLVCMTWNAFAALTGLAKPAAQLAIAFALIIATVIPTSVFAGVDHAQQSETSQRTQRGSCAELARISRGVQTPSAGACGAVAPVRSPASELQDPRAPSTVGAASPRGSGTMPLTPRPPLRAVLHWLADHLADLAERKQPGRRAMDTPAEVLEEPVDDVTRAHARRLLEGARRSVR